MNPETTSELVPSGGNPGETLRAAREARGISLQTVAGQLNLTVSKLQWLEAGEFDKLPGHTFARGYLRNYARLMGMDPNRIALAFDQYTGTNAAGAEVHALGRIDEPSRVSQTLLRLFSLVLLLGLAAFVFYWWQERSSGAPTASAPVPAHIEVEGADGELQYHPLVELEDEAVAAASVPPLESVAPGEATGDVAMPAAEQPGTEAPVAQAPATQSPGSTATQTPTAPTAPVANAPVASAAPAPVAEAPAASAPAASDAATLALPAGHGQVEVSFSDTCWVQVTDADGKVLVGGLRRKGETVSVSGKAPLELRLGVARAATVRYNGQPVDVAPYTTQETARVPLGR